MIQFKKNFLIPLVVAMGNVVMDGVPLPDTIQGVDAGGHAANAPAGNAAQQNQRRVRIRRIFAIYFACTHGSQFCSLQSFVYRVRQ